MNATQAINHAKEHLNMFRPLLEGLRVEGVDKEEESGHWTVVLSFFDDDSSVASALLSQRNRVYKKVKMNENGELLGMESSSK